MARASNLDLVIPEPEQPISLPERYFGAENTHQWCYFYEKADLARQSGEWEAVIDYYEEAKHQGFEPLNGSEYRILVEAWLQQSDSSNALTLKEQLTLEFPEIIGHWCTIAKELLASEILSMNDRSILTTLRTQEACGN
ncbi:MAG: hypothetical protein GX126_07040 [Bacteroidales bacterium]|nr:hypothetical protein [Bacteroidales bacterium]